MIPILTLAEMKAVESKTIGEHGLTEFDMINSAGEAVLETIKTMLADEEFEGHGGGDIDENGHPHLQLRSGIRANIVAFVCGTGHNGADGLAAALSASQSGYSVVVHQIHSESGYSPETEKLQRLLAESEIMIQFMQSPLDLPIFHDVSLIVDGLLGSGISRDPEGVLQSCIFGMNQSGAPILSIDLPSGLRCDSSVMGPGAVQASATLCLGAMKISAAFYPSSQAFGKVGYSSICFDEKLLSKQPSRMWLYTPEDAENDYPERDYTANKYTSGKVLVIAGSLGMHGAAVLSSNGALRAGAGLVKLAYPSGIHAETANHLLEIIGVPIGGRPTLTGSGHFAPEHLAELEPLLEWADSILLGPGLGKHPSTTAFLEALIPRLQGRRVVLDGDALAWFRPDFPARENLGGYDNFILTPHAGEYRKMGGDYGYSDPLDLMRKLRAWTQARNVNVVLKGATTLFAAPDGRLIALPAGNPGMATAGSGDVLAGVITGLLAVLPCEKAATLGTFVHGKAGDLARNDRGTLGLVASDLLMYLPIALKEVEEGGEEENGDWIVD